MSDTNQIQVNFYDTIEDDQLQFVVIIAKFHTSYIFCKHKQRETYELPGGRRESNESILEAAKRELEEETGAINYHIKPICVYSVIGQTRVNESGKETFGMLYEAEVVEFASLHHEIECIELFEELPDYLTYPLIQPVLLKEYERKMKNNDKV